MIILVQPCLLRHGFISAVGASLNDCQFVAAASFSMYEKRISFFAPFNSLNFLLLFPSIIHLDLPTSSSSLSNVYLFFLYWLISNQFHPYFLPFHLSFLICSFSKSLITRGVFAWLHLLRFPGLLSFLSPPPPPTLLTLFLNLYHFPSSTLLCSCNGLRLWSYYKSTPLSSFKITLKKALMRSKMFFWVLSHGQMHANTLAAM